MDLAGKKVLVTGGFGFLGNYVCKTLEQRGALPRRYRSSQYDLTSPRDCGAMFTNERVDCVIHLAAKVGGIGANAANPASFFQENLQMGLNVLNEASLDGVEKLVFIGTVCSYPKFTPAPFKEESLWDGYPEETNAPYGIAKKTLGAMLRSYRQEYNNDFVYVIPANMYGPGDNCDLQTSHVIPALIMKILNAKARGIPYVELWGSGEASRDFLYVEDAAEGIVRSLESLEGSDPINLGTGRECTIKELAVTIMCMVGYEGNIHFNSDRPDGQPRRVLDTSKARQLLGWSAQTSLSEGLKRTITSMKGLVDC